MLAPWAVTREPQLFHEGEREVTQRQPQQIPAQQNFSRQHSAPLGSFLCRPASEDGTCPFAKHRSCVPCTGVRAPELCSPAPLRRKAQAGEGGHEPPNPPHVLSRFSPS